jgi:lactoylglutathione lyase
MENEAKADTDVSQAVPFFAVADMEASLRYYVDGLGFEMTRRWIDEGKLRWCWLQLGTAALMLQEFKKEGQDSWTPECKVGMGVSIYFICRDALTIYRELKARGIPAGRPFVGNGMWVTTLTDPDGYRLMFESPTEVEEDTQLSETVGGSQGHPVAPNSSRSPIG